MSAILEQPVHVPFENINPTIVAILAPLLDVPDAHDE
jgi:hypothetical protein